MRSHITRSQKGNENVKGCQVSFSPRRKRRTISTNGYALMLCLPEEQSGSQESEAETYHILARSHACDGVKRKMNDNPLTCGPVDTECGDQRVNHTPRLPKMNTHDTADDHSDFRYHCHK